MKLYSYAWHSINLIPILYVGAWTDNGTEVAGQFIQLTVLGWVLTVMYRRKGLRCPWDSGVHGPLYSRKRKKLYWASKV